MVGTPSGGCQRGLVLLSGWGGPVVGELSIVEIQGRVILANLGASARPPAVRSRLSSDVVAVIGQEEGLTAFVLRSVRSSSRSHFEVLSLWGGRFLPPVKRQLQHH